MSDRGPSHIDLEPVRPTIRVVRGGAASRADLADRGDCADRAAGQRSHPPVEFERADPDRPTSEHLTERRVAPPAGRTFGLASADRATLVVGALTIVFLALAIAKPWGPSRIGPVIAPVEIPGIGAVLTLPSAEPAHLVDLRRHCQEPASWRVYSQEGAGQPTIREWRSVEPVPSAIDALDPAIPLVQLGPAIQALGYCSPWTGVERPPPTAVLTVWLVQPIQGAGDPIRPLTLRPVAPATPTPLGALLRPVADGAEPGVSETAGWAPGRYVFAIRATAWQRWWAVEVARPSVARAAPGRSVGGPPGVTIEP